MFTLPNYSHILSTIKWRYLDSLDSMRYSEDDSFDVPPDRQLQNEKASMEIAATILMGNGIIVPNNQLMDSFGYLSNLSAIIRAASEFLSQGNDVFLPFKYANFNYNKGEHLRNPFLLTAHLFDMDGKDNRGTFELSAWSDLATYRRDWAAILRSPEPALPDFIKTNAERQLAKDLLLTLYFFTVNPDLVIKAEKTQGIREFMTLSIASLTSDKVEKDIFFLDSLAKNNESAYSDRLTKLMDIVSVFGELKNDGILDNRSEIRKQLRNNSGEYFKSVKGSINFTRTGVLKTIDSIYNYASYKSTTANQDNQTESMNKDSVWGHDEAAFTLGCWARQFYENSQKDKKKVHQISSNQDSLVNPNILSLNPIERKNEFWKIFFDYQLSSSTWNTSMHNYINSLISFKKIKEEFDDSGESKKTLLQSDLGEKVKDYEGSRQHHIDVVNEFLKKNTILNYKIIIDENDRKAYLYCFHKNGDLSSRVQIENFAEYAALTKEQKDSLYAAKPATENVTEKGNIVEQ